MVTITCCGGIGKIFKTPLPVFYLYFFNLCVILKVDGGDKGAIRHVECPAFFYTHGLPGSWRPLTLDMDSHRLETFTHRPAVAPFHNGIILTCHWAASA